MHARGRAAGGGRREHAFIHPEAVLGASPGRFLDLTEAFHPCPGAGGGVWAGSGCFSPPDNKLKLANGYGLDPKIVKLESVFLGNGPNRPSHENQR